MDNSACCLKKINIFHNLQSGVKAWGVHWELLSEHYFQEQLF